MSYNKEIVLCGNCKGEGVLYRHEVKDYHRNDYNVIPSVCIMCNGTGRLWKITKVEFQKL